MTQRSTPPTVATAPHHSVGVKRPTRAARRCPRAFSPAGPNHTPFPRAPPPTHTHTAAPAQSFCTTHPTHPHSPHPSTAPRQLRHQRGSAGARGRPPGGALRRGAGPRARGAPPRGGGGSVGGFGARGAPWSSCPRCAARAVQPAQLPPVVLTLLRPPPSPRTPTQVAPEDADMATSIFNQAGVPCAVIGKVRPVKLSRGWPCGVSCKRSPALRLGTHTHC